MNIHNNHCNTWEICMMRYKKTIAVKNNFKTNRFHRPSQNTLQKKWSFPWTLSWGRSLSYKNQSIDLLCKSGTSVIKELRIFSINANGLDETMPPPITIHYHRKSLKIDPPSPTTIQNNSPLSTTTQKNSPSPTNTHFQLK